MSQIPQGSRVQSVLFNKRYWSLAKAKSKLREMGFSDHGVDETAHRYRFRQVPPTKFKDFRTITAPPVASRPNASIQLVLGFQRKLGAYERLKW